MALFKRAQVSVLLHEPDQAARIAIARERADATTRRLIAAERLFIHHKTLRYRLERIKQLTGLDLARHEDRMRADFALRLLQINGATVDDAVPST